MRPTGKLVESSMSDFERRGAERLNQDRATGVLPADLDPETVASVIATYGQGIWRMALVNYDRPRFERQIEAFLTGLGL